MHCLNDKHQVGSCELQDMTKAVQLKLPPSHHSVSCHITVCCSASLLQCGTQDWQLAQMGSQLDLSSSITFSTALVFRDVVPGVML